VRFPWRSRSESSTTEAGDAGWVRVAQLGAGTNEGATSLWSPDVGDEVAVAFDHGDPDRPVVIGVLYNASALPPVSLPDSKHVSVFRNKSKAGLVSDLTYDNTPSRESLVLHSGDKKITLLRDELRIEDQGKSLVFGNDGVKLESAGQRILLDKSKNEVRLEAGGQSLVIGKSGIVVSAPISTPPTTRVKK
jgi:type VI secretion system secreted protein VgrG